jgi:hypothetical protein
MLLPTICFGWTKTSKALFWTYAAMSVIDAKQTHTIARNPDQYKETNPLYNGDPSVGRVNTYNALAVLANYLITDRLSDENGEMWLSFMIGIRFECIKNNYYSGIEVRF